MSASAGYSYEDPVTKQTFYYPEGLKEMPKEISLSELPWEPVQPFRVEVVDRKPEKDRDDELAMRADFSSHIPSVDTIKRRAKYRPNLWFNFIPRHQRFMLLMTYGPAEQGYDVDSDKVGFEFFGCFESLEEVADHIAMIRTHNPHGVFLHFHTLDVGMGKRIDLPPPNDGSGKTFHLNKQHQQLLSRHLSKSVREAEEVENRVDDAVEDVRRRNDQTKKYNAKLQKHAENILKMDKSNLKRSREEAKKRLEEKLPVLPSEEASASYSVNPGGMSVVQQLSGSVKSLTFDQVEDFIENEDQLFNMTDPRYRTVYRRYIGKDEKQYLVRSIQALE